MGYFNFILVLGFYCYLCAFHVFGQFDLITQEGHRQEIQFMDFNPEGTLLASYGKEGTVFIWDLNKQMKIYERNYTSVYDIRFSKDGNYLLINKGYYLDQWDYKNNLVKEIQVNKIYAYSPDFRYIASSSSENFTVCDANQNDKILIYGKEVRKNENGKLHIRAIGADQKFKVLATLNQNEIKVWDISSIHEDSTSTFREPKLLNTEKIEALKDDRMIKIVSGDSLIHFIFYDNYSNEKEIHIISINTLNFNIKSKIINVPSQVASSKEFYIISLDVRADMKLLAASFWDNGNREVQTFVWDLFTKDITHKIPEFRGVLKLHPSDSKIAYGDKSLIIYDFEKETQTMEIKSFDKDYGMRQMVITKDLTRLVLSTTYSGIDLWDLEQMKLIKNIKNRADGDIMDNSVVRISHNDSLLAYFGGSGVHFYNLKTEKAMDNLVIWTNTNHYVYAFDFSQDDRYLYTFGRGVYSDKLEVYKWDIYALNNIENDQKGQSKNLRGELVYSPKISFKQDNYGVHYPIDFSENGTSMVIGKRGLLKSGNDWKAVKSELEFISLEGQIKGKMIPMDDQIDFIESVFISSNDSIIQLNNSFNPSFKVNFQFNLNEQKWIVNGNESGDEGILIQNHYYFNSNTDSLFRIDINTSESKNLGIKSSPLIAVDRSEKFLFTCGLDNSIELISMDSMKTIIKIYILDSINYFTITADSYYKSSPYGVSKIGLKNENGVYGMDQFDLIKNRPDIILDRIGIASETLVEAYEKAYLKRMKKMDLNEISSTTIFELPKVNIVNSRSILNTTNFEKVEIELLFLDKSTPLKNYTVLVNGVPLFGSAGIDVSNRKLLEITENINIILSEGLNNIQISCTNMSGFKSFEESIVINYIPQVEPTQQTHFIGIGIDKFQEPGHNLSYSVKDIRDLSIALKAKLGDQITIDTLFNENVSLSNVAALKKKLLETNINDKIIIAYSGHGLLSKEYDYYLSSYTVDFHQPEKGGIPYEVLEDLLDSIPARKKLLLIDACHSGEVDKDDFREMNDVAGAKGLVEPRWGAPSNGMSTKTIGLKNSFTLMQELFVNVQKGSGATIISAAAGDQFAYEGGKLENGFFTFALLQYLEKNSSVSINGLKKFVSLEVERLSGGLQKPTSRLENLELDWKLW